MLSASINLTLTLFFNYIVPGSSEIGYGVITSATIRNDKIYAICEYYLGNIKLKVYELKDGPITDIDNSAKTFELLNKLEGFALKFIDASGNCEISHNKLWIRAELRETVTEYENSSYMNWVGYINLDDMSINSDLSFKFPTSKSFPVTGYTINTLTNEFGSALYIEGGQLYSKKNDSYLQSNSIFRYNCTTKDWVDMTCSVNGKLKTSIEHKSAIIYNRYLVILGGRLENSNDQLEKSNVNGTNLNYLSIYNLTVFDTFTSDLETVIIKPDIFDTSVLTFKFDEFSLSVNNDKIIILGGVVGENGEEEEYSNTYIGILDYNSKTWTWNPIREEDGADFKNRISNYLLVYNNQLVVISEVFPIQVYDLLSQRIKSTLRLSDASSIRNSDKAIPTYGIVLIALSCIVLMLALTYLSIRKYKKNTSSRSGKTEYNGPIREVWSNPDIYNTNNIIMG